ncbi:MAG: hypothetical protein GY720_00945 [bacterium]|nr:hypothetical protein [bacterium]
MWQVGMVVADIEPAMNSISEAFGVDWMKSTRTIDIVHGDEPKTIDLTIAITVQGPINLELLEGQDGSPWWPPHGLDHIAAWADDLIGRANRMEAAGFVREVTYQGQPAPMGFSYHRAPSGSRIEHVDAGRRAAMMRWIAGGEYPDVTLPKSTDAPPDDASDGYSPFGVSICRPFHVGQVVTDLEAAMAELSEGLGLEWLSIQERTMHLVTPDGIAPASLRFTYSKGAPHIELLQGEPGTIWGPEHAGLHHVGVWTEDMAADSAWLESHGYPREVTLASRSTDGPSGFTYQRSPFGLRVELVPTSSQPAFANWFAGGEFA